MIKDGLTLSNLISLGAHRFFKGSSDPLLLLKADDAANKHKHHLVDTAKLDDSSEVITGFIEPGSLFIPLKKTIRNVLSDRITIGRSSDNDIIVADKTISKLHGWFLLPKDDFDLWRFCDNDATNGSNINLKPVPPLSPTFIRSGDEIHIGNVRILFLYPDDAHSFCKYVETEWDRASRRGLPKTIDADTIRLHGSNASDRSLQKAAL